VYLVVSQSPLVKSYTEKFSDAARKMAAVVEAARAVEKH
jgi:hypothetical protein